MAGMSKPAQQLGVKAIDPKLAMARYKDSQLILAAEDPATHPANRGDLCRYSLAESAAVDAALVANALYLEGTWHACAEWCRNVGAATVYYLMGDWKEKAPHDDGTLNAAAWFESKKFMTPWVTYFHDGLAWSAIGQHWDVVDELLAFPTDKVLADDEGMAFRNYYLGLSKWWKDDEHLSWVDMVKGTRGSGSKGPHLLCDVVAGIAQSDTKATSTALIKYLQWFLKGRDHEERYPLNATFLWHVARRKGLVLELPDDIDKFLFRLPESA